MSKLIAVSSRRWNGGIATKRKCGSSTVTEFWVYRAEDKENPSNWLVVVGYGKTPGERKTYALNQARKVL